MKLERVDISGFKSFCDKVELTFHEGVTGVVGPNGCGKSNIADAIGWVLGEQSAKSLRGQKMEDVIFSGSEVRPPHSLAEVNLRVSHVNVPVPGRSEDGSTDGDRTGERRKSPKGDVLVTRRLHRSGDSEYLLDGIPSRLRDIQDLFMGTGVGSKAYAIIEQGKIGLILSSKPTDRRVLIEEAAGITKYKSRRRAAELKLAAAQQNLLRVNDIVYEITRQMSSLKRQAGKARRYRRVREALERLDRIVSAKKAERAARKIAAVRAKLAGIADEELRRSTSLTTAEGYLERRRLRQAEKEVALNDAREALHQLELSIDRLDQSIERDRQQLAEVDARRERLEAEHRELEARRGPLLAQIEERRREHGALSADLSGREEGALRQQSLLKEANLSLHELESRIEEKRSEIVNRISKIAALHNFLQGVLANADKVSSELLKLEEEVREVDAEDERLHRELSEASGQLETERERARTLAADRAELEEKNKADGAALDALDERIASAKESLSSMTARRESLEELVAARAHFGSGARLLLTRGAERGLALKGSLADAIEVDERLERAAEAFFESALQRVRVASEHDVGPARRLLEESAEDGGRAELLVEGWPRRDRSVSADLGAIVERLRARGETGIVGRLHEGVRWHEEPVPGALPDAIVVESYDVGVRLYRREPAPYVTLDGEVLDSPGIVRVGPRGAAEGLLETRRHIRELSERIAEARSALDASCRDRRELVNRVEGHRESLEALRERQHALEKRIVGLEHRSSQLEEERGRCEKKRAILQSERERSRSEKSSFAMKRAEMEAALEAEETRKAESEEALDARRAELATRRGRVEELQLEAAEASSRLAALRERRDAVGLDVERLSEGLAELETRLAANGTERERLAQSKQSLSEGIGRAETGLENAVAERATKVELTRSLEEEVARLRERGETTETALKARRRELSAVQERRAAEEVVLARVESDLAHVQESFRQSHGVPLETAAGMLSPLDLARDEDEAQQELVEQKAKLDAMGPVNPMADEEFEELSTRHEFVTKQRQDLLDSIASTETAIGRIDRTSRRRFREAFDAVNEEFALTFAQLFGGGRAGLRLVDETDILETGVDVIAQPPGKKLQNVLLLSGGEKALTAIALLFAIFRYRPSPFCLLDEVDAPLDDANVGRFLSMLRELRETTQFIIITHNRKTMEMVDRLYGVTMEEPGASKIVSVNIVADEPEPAEAVAPSV